MCEEGNFSIEDNLEMLGIISYSELQLLIYNSFDSIKSDKEKVEDHVDNQSNQEAIFTTVIGHKKGVKTQLDRVNQDQ